MKEWGPKSSVCPSKPGKSNFFGRDSPGFCRDIPGAPEKFEKKKLCSILVPYSTPRALFFCRSWDHHEIWPSLRGPNHKQPQQQFASQTLSNSSKGSPAYGHYPRKPSENPAEPRRPPLPPADPSERPQILQCVSGRGRSGGQIAGGHPKASPWPRQPLCSAGIERARKCLQGFHFMRCCHSTHGLHFRGSVGVTRGGAAAVCDPNPPRPFARYRQSSSESLGVRPGS